MFAHVRSPCGLALPGSLLPTGYGFVNNPEGRVTLLLFVAPRLPRRIFPTLSKVLALSSATLRVRWVSALMLHAPRVEKSV